MNTNYKRLRTTFAPETRFEIKPTPPAPFRVTHETRFERLKNELLNEKISEVLEARLTSPLRRAANEAAALAWITAYPLLVFPGLFEEKATEALLHEGRRELVLQRSRDLLVV